MEEDDALRYLIVTPTETPNANSPTVRGPCKYDLINMVRVS